MVVFSASPATEIVIPSGYLVTDKKEANSCKCSEHEATGMDGMY